MIRPDPVLEKWLQEQERKLIRAQTDLVRFQQQPRRGSAGEALLFNALSQAIPRRECLHKCNDWYAVKIIISGFEDVECYADRECSIGPSGPAEAVSYSNLSVLNGTWIAEGLIPQAASLPYPGSHLNDIYHSDTVCSWRILNVAQMPVGVYDPIGTFVPMYGAQSSVDVSIQLRYISETDASNESCSGIFLDYPGMVLSIAPFDEFYTAYAPISYHIPEASIDCNAVNSMTPVCSGPLTCGVCASGANIITVIAGTTTPWDHTSTTITIERYT